MDDKTDNTLCLSRRRNNQPLVGTDLRGIFSSATDAVFAIDHARRIVYQNRAFTEIFPHGASAISRSKCYEVVCGHTLDGKKFCHPDCPVGKSLLKGRPVKNFGLSVSPGNREPIWINAGAMPVSGMFDDVAAIFVLRPVGTFGAYSHPANDKKRTDSIPPDIRHKLTRRERQILNLLAKGFDAKGLASTLHISHVTARNHIQHIYAKLGFHNRAEAVSYVFRKGLMR